MVLYQVEVYLSGLIFHPQLLTEKGFPYSNFYN
jgi:hypothetical protein